MHGRAILACDYFIQIGFGAVLSQAARREVRTRTGLTRRGNYRSYGRRR